MARPRRAARGRPASTLLLLASASALASGPASAQTVADEWLGSPVNDGTFQTYLDFFTYDRQLPFDLQVIDIEEQEGVRREHLSFQSTAGVTVFANYYRPLARAARKRPSIVLIHGGVPRGKDAPSTRLLAQELVRGGFNVLAIDMLYFGERKTDLLAVFTEQEKHERLYNQPSTFLAWIAQTVKDAGRSIDLLVQERGADPERIGLVGFSRGAQVGFIVGGAEPRFAAVAVLYGGHFDALERGHLPAACPANFIGRISPRPLFMLNGDHDSDYKKETSVLPLQRLAGEPKLALWADTGHEMPPPKFRARLLDWLRENL